MILALLYQSNNIAMSDWCSSDAANDTATQVLLHSGLEMASNDVGLTTHPLQPTEILP